jgi:hypothetical protein
MRRIGAEGTTMPDDTAARRGPGKPQDVDRHVARRIRERRVMESATKRGVLVARGVEAG